MNIELKEITERENKNLKNIIKAFSKLYSVVELDTKINFNRIETKDLTIEVGTTYFHLMYKNIIALFQASLKYNIEIDNNEITLYNDFSQHITLRFLHSEL